MRSPSLLIGFSLLFIQLFNVDVSPIAAQAGGAYDLVEAVNQLRIASGLSPMQVDGSLMAAAQGQSDYQASIGSVTHTGAGGTRPRDRAVAAGYSGSMITENIAAGMDLSLGGAVSIWQGDDLHLNTMLGNNQDVGAGVAVSGMVVYYTLLVGTREGSANSPAPVSTTQPGSSPVPPQEIITAVQTSTPGSDSSIIHVVQPGENPLIIANAYDVELSYLIEANNLGQNPVIYPGDILLIKPAPTPTSTSEPTATIIPTNTPKPPRTPVAKRTEPAHSRTTIDAAVVLDTPTTIPGSTVNVGSMSRDPLLLAIGLLALSGVLLMVVGSALKRGM